MEKDENIPFSIINELIGFAMDVVVGLEEHWWLTNFMVFNVQIDRMSGSEHEVVI